MFVNSKLNRPTLTIKEKRAYMKLTLCYGQILCAETEPFQVQVSKSAWVLAFMANCSFIDTAEYVTCILIAKDP
jgi:hypothetical protein